ncbi:hypothetical protein [Psychroflexus lacisalsi]|jgi:hypothetical protein|uniref:Outer membrane protein beta-barrel domain-containing protein n=1 Tax=Psychroflexus lacisalsi TaxID=503928 RepID=A0ABP3VAA4_9FLAO|nr:hypothetical protein [Psychroflexus lacisalsi]MBZ9618694.1 hypothetical protein [Psychroflexus lacisalsi]
MKYFILSICIFFTVSIEAQNLAGAQVSFDSDRDNAGIGFKGVFGLSNSLSFSPDINYFFGSASFATVNTDLHLDLAQGNNLKFYGLGGLHFGALRSISSRSGFLGFNRDADVNLGVNLGLGAQLFTKDNFRLFTEGKYIVSDLNRFVLSIGMLFNL